MNRRASLSRVDPIAGPLPGAGFWWLWRDGSHPAAWNMAVDHLLLERAPALAQPLLRFYGWTESAATFGYSQKYAEVAAMSSLRPLVRRPTGGGLVPHDRDWTYSLVFPAGHPWYGLPATTSYELVHAWMQAALRELSWSTELAPTAAKEAPGRCFAGPERHDLLWQGAKVAGAAQRRARTALLIQGSLQPPAQWGSRGRWEEAVIRAGAVRGVNWQEFRLDEPFLSEAQGLQERVYSTEAHNRRR